MLDVILRLFNFNWQNIFESNTEKNNTNDEQRSQKNKSENLSWSIEQVLSTTTTTASVNQTTDSINQIKQPIEKPLSDKELISNEVSIFYNGWISPKGIEFLIEHEGIVTHWYSDNGKSTGNQTIGIGHLLQAGDQEKYPNELDLETIKILLIEDLKSPIQSVKNLAAKRSLNQNQKDALVSFIFNIGSGNWAKSTVLKLLSDPNFEITNTTTETDSNSMLENAFMKFIYSNSQVLNGLKKRRQAEYQLFVTATE
ncbi:MAG: lysozyme [Deltaproteobacteria bacterium]|jgi:GH24 family phage-related lysozyme (muramidase)|nr:lysozyme [Deltaproteobacteria bacterium]